MIIILTSCWLYLFSALKVVSLTFELMLLIFCDFGVAIFIQATKCVSSNSIRQTQSEKKFSNIFKESTVEMFMSMEFMLVHQININVHNAVCHHHNKRFLFFCTVSHRQKYITIHQFYATAVPFWYLQVLRQVGGSKRVNLL